MLTGEPFFHIFEAGGLFHAEDVGRQPVVEGRPFPRPGQTLHLAQQGGGVFQPLEGFGVGLRSHEVLPAVVPRGAEQLLRGPGRAGGLLHQNIMPAGAGKAVLVLPRGQHLVQLFIVVRQGAEEVIDLQNRLPRRLVGAALAVEVGEGAEVRILIGRFQCLGEGRVPQHLHAAGVGGGEVGRDVQRLKVLAEQVEAEGVDGADGGSLQQHPLAAEGRVARLCLTAAAQRLPDAGAELCGGRVRKGDDEQFVGVDGAFRVGDEPDGTFGQHRRLAAARSRTDQQRTAPVVDGGTLGRGPFCLAHWSSSFFLSEFSGGSNGFAGASSARSPMPSSWQQMKP